MINLPSSSEPPEAPPPLVPVPPPSPATPPPRSRFPLIGGSIAAVLVLLIGLTLYSEYVKTQALIGDAPTPEVSANVPLPSPSPEVTPPLLSPIASADTTVVTGEDLTSGAACGGTSPLLNQPDDVALTQPSQGASHGFLLSSFPHLLKQVRAAVTQRPLDMRNIPVDGALDGGSCFGIAMLQQLAVGEAIDLTEGAALTDQQVNAIAEQAKNCTGRNELPNQPLQIPRASLHAVTNRIQTISTGNQYAANPANPAHDRFILRPTDSRNIINEKLYGAANAQVTQQGSLLHPYGGRMFGTENDMREYDGAQAVGEASGHSVTLWASVGEVTVIDSPVQSSLILPGDPQGVPGRLCWKANRYSPSGNTSREVKVCASLLRDRMSVGPSGGQLPPCNS